MKTPLKLYIGPNCKLCHEAEELLYQAGLSADQLEKVDVTSSLELKKAYGIKIPVLQKSEDGKELCWPFDLAGLCDFLRD